METLVTAPDVDAPELSLVLPCYNEEDVLRNTVERLVGSFRQHHVALELILVDNGSTDGTARLIDQLALEDLPVVKVTVPVNQGYGYGVLRGLAHCRGRLVGFVCADGQVEAGDVVKVYQIAAHAASPRLVKVRRRFRMDGFSRKVVSICYNLLAAAGSRRFRVERDCAGARRRPFQRARDHLLGVHAQPGALSLRRAPACRRSARAGGGAGGYAPDRAAQGRLDGRTGRTARCHPCALRG
jgi:glycosyltransferase involved in cell wall biosynthesis